MAPLSSAADAFAKKNGGDCVLSLASIHKTYGGRSILRDISFDVFANEWIVLLGSSGSGKSTLLKMIAGLDTPDRGTIALQGRNVSHLPPHKRDCSLAFQSNACYDHWTVQQNLSAACDPRAAHSMNDLVEEFELTHLLKSKPPQLSGGELGRVSLLRALLSSKHFLMLDEPLAQLNPRFRSIAMNAIQRNHRTFQRTTLYVTHELPEAMLLADRIVLLQEGRIAAIGTPRMVYEMLLESASDYVTTGVRREQLLVCRERSVVPTEWKLLAVQSKKTGDTSFDESFHFVDGRLQPMHDSVTSLCVHAGYHIASCRLAGAYWAIELQQHAERLERIAPGSMVLHLFNSPWLPELLKKQCREWELGIHDHATVWIAHA